MEAKSARQRSEIEDRLIVLTGLIRLQTLVTGQERRFEQLKPFLASLPADGEYDVLASHLNMTARAVGAAVYRMRQRYRQLVRQQVADTVAQSDQVDTELHQIFDGLQ